MKSICEQVEQAGGEHIPDWQPPGEPDAGEVLNGASRSEGTDHTVVGTDGTAPSPFTGAHLFTRGP